MTIRKIFKYPIKITGKQKIEMPLYAEILSVQMQACGACIWAIVEPEAGTEKRDIRIYGTGHLMGNKENLEHIGTIQQASGALVWHVFEAT